MLRMFAIRQKGWVDDKEWRGIGEGRSCSFVWFFSGMALYQHRALIEIDLAIDSYEVLFNHFHIETVSIFIFYRPYLYSTHKIWSFLRFSIARAQNYEYTMFNRIEVHISRQGEKDVENFFLIYWRYVYQYQWIAVSKVKYEVFSSLLLQREESDDGTIYKWKCGHIYSRFLPDTSGRVKRKTAILGRQLNCPNTVYMCQVWRMFSSYFNEQAFLFLFNKWMFILNSSGYPFDTPPDVCKMWVFQLTFISSGKTFISCIFAYDCTFKKEVCKCIKC